MSSVQPLHSSGWKLYSFHAPEVECIGKGEGQRPLRVRREGPDPGRQLEYSVGFNSFQANQIAPDPTGEPGWPIETIEQITEG